MISVCLPTAKIILFQRLELILQLEIISSAPVVGLAVVGLIDQQRNFAVFLSIAEIILFHRFACWSKRPTGAYPSIGNYIVSRCCWTRRCWSY